MCLHDSQRSTTLVAETSLFRMFCLDNSRQALLREALPTAGAHITHVHPPPLEVQGWGREVNRGVARLSRSISIAHEMNTEQSRDYLWTASTPCKHPFPPTSTQTHVLPLQESNQTDLQTKKPLIVGYVLNPEVICWVCSKSRGDSAE